MPAKQGLGLHEEPDRRRRSSGRPSAASRARSEGRNAGRNDLTAQHGDLVAEQDDLDRQLVPVAPAELHQLEDPGEGEVEERQGDGPVSSLGADSRKPGSRHPGDILGTHRGALSWDVCLRGAKIATPAPWGGTSRPVRLSAGGL